MRKLVPLIAFLLLSSCGSSALVGYYILKCGGPGGERDVSRCTWRGTSVFARRHAPARPVRLLTGDGEGVARLDADTLPRDEFGALPNTILWHGRTFERGWTNEGNTDADERLWYEVKPNDQSKEKHHGRSIR